MKVVLHATNKGHNYVDPLNISLNVSSYFLSFHQDRSKAWWLFTVKGVKFYRQTAFLWSDPSPGLSPPPLPFMSAWCMMGDVSPRLLASTYPFLQLRPSFPLMSSPSISLTHTDKCCKILKEGPYDPIATHTPAMRWTLQSKVGKVFMTVQHSSSLDCLAK